jgi:hypothetical protein
MFLRIDRTTFGNVKADVLADRDPRFTPTNFCSVIRGSAGEGERTPSRQSKIRMLKSFGSPGGAIG